MPSTPEHPSGTGPRPAPGLLRIVMYRRPVCLAEWVLGVVGVSLLCGPPLGLAAVGLWLLS